MLPHIHQLLTPDVALSQGRWVMGEWSRLMTSPDMSPSDRAHVALFLGRINLYLAQYAQASEFFRQAAQAAPEVASSAATEMLIPEMLPPALSAQDADGNAHYILAQAHRALGDFPEALQEVDLALDLGIRDGSSYPEAPVQQFKADLLEAMGEKEEAATWFYEAGVVSLGGTNTRPPRAFSSM